MSILSQAYFHNKEVVYAFVEDRSGRKAESALAATAVSAFLKWAAYRPA